MILGETRVLVVEVMPYLSKRRRDCYECEDIRV